MGTKAFRKKEDKICDALYTPVMLKCSGKDLEVNALWDTGATMSCISMSVVGDLELTPIGKRRTFTPSGERIANTYLLDVMLPNDFPVLDLLVCDSEIGAQGIGMLVGMDIISQGDFLITNYQGKTVFSFRSPSEYLLDFTSGINARNVIGRTRNSRKRKSK